MHVCQLGEYNVTTGGEESQPRVIRVQEDLNREYDANDREMSFVVSDMDSQALDLECETVVGLVLKKLTHKYLKKT